MGGVLAVLQPPPFAALIAKGGFSKVLLLSRFSLVVELFSEDVPPSAWLQSTTAVHDKATRPPLRASQFDTISEQLRRLVPESDADRRAIAGSVDFAERVALTVCGGACLSEGQLARHRIRQALLQRKFKSSKSVEGV